MKYSTGDRVRIIFDKGKYSLKGKTGTISNVHAEYSYFYSYFDYEVLLDDVPFPEEYPEDRCKYQFKEDQLELLS